MAKKPKLKTIQMRDRWRAGKVGLYAGVVASPLVPSAVVLGINWDEWFNEAGISLPFGFACLILAVVSAIVAILKSDVILKKVDIALYIIGGIFLLIGIADLFMASLFATMGKMWIIAGGGLLGSATFNIVEKKVVEPNLAFYNKLIEENCLDAKSKRKKAKEEQARKDAEEDAKRQAVE